MSEFLRTPLSDIGPFKLAGGAGAEPTKMMAGLSAVGAPVVGEIGAVEPAAQTLKPSPQTPQLIPGAF